MLAPYSVRLYFDQSDSFRCSAEDSAQVDAYIKAMRVVQQRTGTAPRAALNNCAPVHIESLAGSLSVVRVSGLPHLQNPAHDPVQLAASEQALFMKRGDHYILKTERDGIEHVAYVALDYSIAPRLITSDRAIVLRNPIDAMVADMNATRLLEIIQNRELTATEQFVASQTMPTIWKRHGGPPVAAITHPTVEDAAECYEFAQQFSDPYRRIRSVAEMSSAWAKAFHIAEHEHVEPVPTVSAALAIDTLARAPETLPAPTPTTSAEPRPARMRM